MKFTKITFYRTLGAGLLALLACLPLIHAQQQQQPNRGTQTQRVESAPRVEPSRAPVERSVEMVNRSNHGSIRHVDTAVIEHPAAVVHPVVIEHPAVVAHPGVVEHPVTESHYVNIQQQHVIVHRDVEVDVNRPRYWHGFVYGARLHHLRPGCVRIYVNNVPYFYDDGIYYQPVDDDYQEVYPPVGADVSQLPDGAIEIDAGNLTYYYAGGAFYVQQDDGFVIAPPPMGVTVPELPPGAVQVSARNGSAAYQFNGIYYEPVFVNGVTQYMTFMP